MKVFLKKEELQLVNGGYLSGKDEKPVGNAEFVKAQKERIAVVIFARSTNDEKRQLLGYLFSNLELEGSKLVYALQKPFNLFADFL